jgi:glycosyltransferase involved in cell wall biosynthesis
MQAKVMYCTGMFHPENEAISKEIDLLRRRYQDSFVYSRTSRCEMSFSKDSLRYWDRVGILDNLLGYMETKYDISHIYHVLNSQFFLRRLRKAPIILTACSENGDIEGVKQFLHKAERIVVQSEKMMKKLCSKGIPADKIVIIYPGLDLSKFRVANPSGEKFKILFASAPLFANHFDGRGVRLLLESSGLMENVHLTLLWRKRVLKQIKTLVSQCHHNVSLINRTIKDVSLVYDRVNATVAPFTDDRSNKSCPNSVLESLASGKPVLVSDKVGISGLIEKEKCGVVFKPNPNAFVSAVEELRRHYDFYQERAIPVAKKYFSLPTFLQKYDDLYSDLM